MTTTEPPLVWKPAVLNQHTGWWHRCPHRGLVFMTQAMLADFGGKCPLCESGPSGADSLEATGLAYEKDRHEE